jgi:hypothetical protein
MNRGSNVPVAQAFRPEGFLPGGLAAMRTERLTPEGVSYKGVTVKNVGAPTLPKWNPAPEVAA